jgi:DNA-binding IclR family transcriptional regulator
VKVKKRSTGARQGEPVSDAARRHTHIFRSAYRAMLLLDRLERSLQGKRLVELSSELGFDKGTAFRLLETLVAERALVKDAETGRYASDSTSWAHFADYLRPATALISSAQAALDGVTAETSATCLLTLPLLNCRAAVAPMYAVPDRSVYYDPGRAPESVLLHASAAGKCYLAGLPTQELDRYLELPLARATDRTVISPSALRKELAAIRREGYATNKGESHEGVWAVAVPLQTPSGATAGGLALGSVGEAVAESRAAESLPLLQTAAGHLSRLMTYESWLSFARQTGADRLRPQAVWDSPDPPTVEGGLSRVRTVARATRLTALLFTHPTGLSVGEVARHRGLPKSAAWRLLNTLAAAGIVWQDAPDSRYRINPLFWLARARVLASATSQERAIMSLLTELAQQMGETVSIGVPAWGGRRLLVPWYALPNRAVCCRPTGGPAAFLHTTATGKCYLAAVSKAHVMAYIQQGLPALTDRSITSGERLLRELGDVSRQGYALSREEAGLGVSSLAVPLRDETGTVVGGLAVASVTTEVTAAQIKGWLSTLQAAADGLSQLIPEHRGRTRFSVECRCSERGCSTTPLMHAPPSPHESMAQPRDSSLSVHPRPSRDSTWPLRPSGPSLPIHGPLAWRGLSMLRRRVSLRRPTVSPRHGGPECPNGLRKGKTSQAFRRHMTAKVCREV